MKSFALLVISIFIIAGCSREPETVTEQIEVTRIVEQTNEIEVTRLVERQVEATRLVEVPVEVTRLVENVVTATPTEQPRTQTLEDRIALNDVGQLTSGGLEVRVARMLLATDAGMEELFGDEIAINFDQAIGSELYGEVILVITNTTDLSLSIYPELGTVQINSEQINLSEFQFPDLRFGDSLGGEILPGVTKIGGFWFGSNRNQVNDIGQLIYRFDGPADSDSGVQSGDDFEFVIDLSNRVFEPLPQDLVP